MSVPTASQSATLSAESVGQAEFAATDNMRLLREGHQISRFQRISARSSVNRREMPERGGARAAQVPVLPPALGRNSAAERYSDDSVLQRSSVPVWVAWNVEQIAPPNS
jgi:hypothetical protein